MATIFATCNIGKAIDDHGNPIIPKVEYTELFVRWVVIQTIQKGFG